uniref:Uncharacterized protein n=1 Tax=Anguilla anguilla TaxID=7936 RepID=A0A0E9WA40_ANGAN
MHLPNSLRTPEYLNVTCNCKWEC